MGNTDFIKTDLAEKCPRRLFYSTNTADVAIRYILRKVTV